MSAGVTISCDGHRAGQPCRGALHTRAQSTFDARFHSGDWRSVYVEGSGVWLDLCPSSGHDEDDPARHADDGPGP